MLLHGLRFMIKFNLWQGDVVHVILHFTRQGRHHSGRCETAMIIRSSCGTHLRAVILVPMSMLRTTMTAVPFLGAESGTEESRGVTWLQREYTCENYVEEYDAALPSTSRRYRYRNRAETLTSILTEILPTSRTRIAEKDESEHRQQY